jgi:hypothetical protein
MRAYTAQRAAAQHPRLYRWLVSFWLYPGSPTSCRIRPKLGLSAGPHGKYNKKALTLWLAAPSLPPWGDCHEAPQSTLAFAGRLGERGATRNLSSEAASDTHVRERPAMFVHSLVVAPVWEQGSPDAPHGCG